MWMRKWNLISKFVAIIEPREVPLISQTEGEAFQWHLIPLLLKETEAQHNWKLDRYSLVYFMTVTFKYVLTYICLKCTLMPNPRN